MQGLGAFAKMPHDDKTQEPIRVLHVVGRMDRAGLETWIVRVLERLDLSRFQVDILVHASEPGAYDVEVRALGCRIFVCPHVSRPWIYATEFKRILREQGPYDIVHSHVHFFGGYVLKLAQLAQVPCRIAHSHNDQSTVERQKSWLRQGYLQLMKYWIRQAATHGLATSAKAAQDLFGSAWVSNPRIQVIYCGLDLTPFEAKISPAAVRQSWKIPDDAWVMGHVGRFETPKNHHFLIQVAAEVMDQCPKAYLMLVGKGSLRSDIEQQATALGIGDRVIFTGIQSDPSSLLLGAFDLFLFPSLHEGLGVALLEAQVAGLPCVISTAVPQEADLIPTLVKRLSLEQSSADWANALIAHAQGTPRQSVETTLALVRQSPFNMENSVPLLADLYAHATRF
jgi:glycosyltransferase involved in cell wall biosynthesis